MRQNGKEHGDYYILRGLGLIGSGMKEWTRNINYSIPAFPIKHQCVFSAPPETHSCSNSTRTKMDDVAQPLWTRVIVGYVLLVSSLFVTNNPIRNVKL